MGLGIFHNSKRGFSDEEIDAFVASLKENHMTLENEHEAKEIIHSNANDDPRRLREKKLTPLLVISNDSQTYNLWSRWNESHKNSVFEPLEFMSEHIEAAHETWLHNRKTDLENADDHDGISELQSMLSSGQPLVTEEEKLDDNERQIFNFEKDIENCAVTICMAENSLNMMSDENEANEIKVTDKIIEEQSSSTVNLKSLGGFESFDEAVKELEFVGITLDDDSSFKVNADEISSDVNKILEEQGEDFSDDECDKCIEIHDGPVIMFRFSSDKIRAWIFIFPATDNTRDITEDEINKVLEDNEVTYGVDKFMIHKIVKEKLYFKLIQIATGVDPVHGKNGSLEELISREKKIELKEDQNGKVNYRELNMIKSVSKGDVICNITLPTKGTDGLTVTNKVIKSIDGKYPDVPQGMNTELSEDRTKLVAKIDGEVTFENGKYRIQKILNIEGDVDSSVGNIDFSGDLVVNGDVREGFTIRTGGNLIVKGTVESCTLIVGGNISIDHSVLGGKKAVIKCEGSFTANYVENCTICAKKNVNVGNVLWSDISSDDSVIVYSDKGSITGGKITAGKTVKARVIGSKTNSSITTKIILGSAPSDIEMKERLLVSLAEVKDNILKMQQNITYIEKKNDITPERQKLLDQLKMQYQMRMLQKTQMEKRLSKTSIDILKGLESAKLFCDYLYPVVSVTVGGQTIAVKNECRNCRITFVNKEIKLDFSEL